MSIQFSVAAVLLNRGIRHGNWERYDDPEARALAARCSLTVDEAITAAAPRSGAGVTVEMKSGARFAAGADDFRSMTPDEVRARFLNLAGARFGVVRAQSVLRRLDALHEAAAGDLAALFRELAAPEVAA